MGYGFGVFLGAVGLILALAVRDAVESIDLVMTGWILAAAGGVLVLLTAAQDAARRRGARSTYAGGPRAYGDQRQPPPA